MTARPTCRTTLLLGLLPFVCACSDSDSSDPPSPVVASSTIGPDGGALVVEQGRQQGLVLTIPAGALQGFVELRIVDEDAEAIGVAPTSFAPLPGAPFRIEPVDLVLPVPAQLRAPYRPGNLFQTAPGNVRLMQQSPWTEQEFDPAEVDVAGAMLTIGVKTFGSFRVVAGVPAPDVAVYLPPRDEVAMMAGGYRFAVEPVPATSPFAAQNGELWRVTGPGIDESLIFVSGSLVGRRAEPDTWREVWATPVEALVEPAPFGAAGSPLPVEVVCQFESPIGAPPLGSRLFVWTELHYDVPRALGARTVRDVVRLAVDISYQQPNANGERRLDFYLAADEGLVALSLDGAVYERIP